MNRRLRAGALALGLLAWCRSAAEAQDPPRIAPPTRFRVVVFQFVAAPDDSAHRALAESLSRSLVKTLLTDQTFQVLSHPRGSRNGTGNDAQYAILGAVSELQAGLRVDLRVTDIAHVALVAHDSATLAGTSGPSLDLMAASLAIRIRDRLTTLK
jgi:TolB-like protein